QTQHGRLAQFGLGGTSEVGFQEVIDFLKLERGFAGRRGQRHRPGHQPDRQQPHDRGWPSQAKKPAKWTKWAKWATAVRGRHKSAKRSERAGRSLSVSRAVKGQR